MALATSLQLNSGRRALATRPQRPSSLVPTSPGLGIDLQKVSGLKAAASPCSAADAMVRQQGMALAKEDPRDSKTGCKISGGNAPLDVFDAMAGKKHGKFEGQKT